MQVLFNYGPNYIATYCSAVGTAYLAQSTTAPGFNAPSNNPPQPVRPPPFHLQRQQTPADSSYMETQANCSLMSLVLMGICSVSRVG